jgi:hypothetical protein
MQTVGKFEASEVTVGWIRNTLDLSVIALSESLMPQIESNPALEVLSPARELEFDRNGNVVDVMGQAISQMQTSR